MINSVSVGRDPGYPWVLEYALRARLEPGITYRRIEFVGGFWAAPLGTPDPGAPVTAWIDLGTATTGEADPVP